MSTPLGIATSSEPRALTTETPVSPVEAPTSSAKAYEATHAGAGGLLGSPRPETPVSPVSPVEEALAASDFFQRALAAESKAQSSRAKLSSSVFSILQYEKHADTGEVMVTQDQIDMGLGMTSIKRFAYAWHDSDRFDDTEAQSQQEAGRPVKAGDLKPRHVHIVIQCDHDYTIRQISNWLQIPSARVQIPKELAAKEGRTPYTGRNAREKAFYDLAQYLTHEGTKQQYKHQYGRDIVVANFDFGSALDEHMSTRLRGGTAASTKVDALMLAVMDGKLSLRDVRRDHPVEYGKHLDKFIKWRGDYLRHQPAPPHRIAFYFEGPGGVGKDLLAKALARTLAPGDWIPGVHDPFFSIGGENVTWQGYDGQPVVIFEEARVENLIHTMGRKELFTFMNPFPEKQAMHVKFGSTQPINTITIFTGPDPYGVFLDGLAGEYVDRSGVQHKSENKAQSRRRVPFIIPVREGEFDLLVNKGFADNTREFQEYYEYRNIRQSIEQVQIRTKGISDAPRRLETLLAIEAQQVAPIRDQFNRVLAAKTTVDEDPAALMAEFASLGKPIPADEVAAAKAAREAADHAAKAAQATKEARFASLLALPTKAVPAYVG